MQWAKAGSYSLVKTRTANLRVYWLADILPPEVFVGRMVCAVGRIKTWDGGKHWAIVGAVPLGGKRPLKKLMSAIDRTIADPTEWCPHLLDGKYRPRLTGGRDYP